MKKILFIAIVLFCLINSIYYVSAEQEKAVAAVYKIQINSAVREIKNPVVCIHDRTYLPLRETAELLNLYVVWDDEEKMIKISNIGFAADGENIPFVLSGVEETAYPSNFRVKINGYFKELENSPYVIRNRAYLPLRELAELLGAKVEWLAETKTVSIAYDRYEEDAKQMLIPFEKDGLYGYVDLNGSLIVEAKYKFALPFSDGLAAVADERYKFGYIDTQGNLVIPHQFFQAKDFSEGFAAVAVSDWEFDENESLEQIEFVVFHELANSYFYIDKTGKKAFEKEFRQAGSFCNGYAPVAIVENADSEVYNRGDYTAYIDNLGEIVKKYKINIGGFHDGYAMTEDGIINTNLEIVFAGAEYDGYSFNDGFITAKKDGKYGVVDFQNNVIIDFKYGFLSGYNEGLFAFKTAEGCGYIDINENMIIPPMYAYTDEFIGGRAVVYSKDKENTLFYINKKGEQISKDIEGSSHYIWPNGVMMVYPESGGEGTFVDFNGEPILPKQF